MLLEKPLSGNEFGKNNVDIRNMVICALHDSWERLVTVSGKSYNSAWLI